MTDPFSKERRSQIMANIRSKNTAPEKLLFAKAKELYRSGYRYRKHYKKIAGKPDLVFTKQKLAVFIDSEFWHGKDFHIREERLPKVYWRDKIRRNIERDIKVSELLKDGGWGVIRIWAKDFAKDPDRYIKEIQDLLKEH